MGLLVGSEGTLAIVTEITVRLLVGAEGVAAVLAAFDGVVPASEAVSAIIGQGIVPVALEMMDGMTTRAVAAGLPEDAGAVLLIECEGLREELDDKEGTAGNRASHLPSTTAPATYGLRSPQRIGTRCGRRGSRPRGALGTLAPELLRPRRRGACGPKSRR